MATKSDSGFGLLSEYGLDLGTEQDVRSKLRHKRITEAAKMFVPEPSDYKGISADPTNISGTFGRLGAAVGNAFGEKKTGYGDLPPEIANRLNTVKSTKEAYARWEAANPEVPVSDRMDRYQEILAEQAFKNDLPDVGLPILRQLTDRRDAKAKQQAELKKLNLDNQYDEATLEARKSKALYEGGAPGIVTIYPRGSANPNAGLTGHMDPQGNVTVVKEDGTEEILHPSKYTFNRPQWHPASYQGSGGGTGKYMTPTEKGQVRKALVGAMNLNDNYLAVLDLAREAREIGAGNIQGQFGKLTSLAGKAVTFAEQVGGLFSPTGERVPMKVVGDKRDYDMTSKASRQQWINDNADWVKSQFPGLELKARYADRFIALVTDLTYAQAMANEGGTSRSLSDNDFKQNFIAIGGNINNPQTLTEILVGGSDRQDSRLSNLLSVYPPEVVKGMIAEGGLDRYQDGLHKLDRYRTGEAWGVKPAAEKPKGLPLRKGWTQEDWDALTPEEQASLQ